jgi:hypothetical protein
MLVMYLAAFVINASPEALIPIAEFEAVEKAYGALLAHKLPRVAVLRGRHQQLPGEEDQREHGCRLERGTRASCALRSQDSRS